MSQELEQKLIRASARAAIAEAGVAKSMKMLLPLVEARIGIIGGEVLPLDADGEPEAGGLARVIDELRRDPETAAAFATVEREQDTSRLRSSMNTAEKVAFIKEHGEIAYQALPWDAPVKDGPASWPVSKKCAYIAEHGSEAYVDLLAKG